MPKYDIEDDPAFALNEDAKALARERILDRHLAKLATAERIRNEASDIIKTLWTLVEADGFDLREARQRFLRQALRR